MTADYTVRGAHLIAGEWVKTDTTFTSSPASGEALTISVAGPREVDMAVEAAEAAFASFSALSRADRATFMDTVADEIEARGEAITAIGSAETALPTGRLEGERGRTVSQMRLFAEHIRKGDYLDMRYDPALPDRKPLPRPKLRMIQRPIGPVAIFGASNFPLAFSTGGGDTAAAFAAGCPVVVKGHQAHPATGEIVADAIHAALKKCGLHPGVFSLLQGDTIDLGQALVKHPLIKAVGFTGSLRAGRALYDLCAQRPEPIPFFGELGSVNPVFVLPAAAASRAPRIGDGWAGSLTMGVGQFCTNPGIIVIPDGPEADIFTEAAIESLSVIQPQTMLTDGIAKSYRQGCSNAADDAGISSLLHVEAEGRQAGPAVLSVSGSDWLANPNLQEEVFGPFGIIVRVDGPDQMKKIAAALHGQLTCTLQMDDDDHALAKNLVPILERKAGRLLANGFPTGVEVADAMVHSGPYPASTNFGATSVGTLAIRRFLRPVCYQDLPDDLLPEPV